MKKNDEMSAIDAFGHGGNEAILNILGNLIPSLKNSDFSKTQQGNYDRAQAQHPSAYAAGNLVSNILPFIADWPAASVVKAAGLTSKAIPEVSKIATAIKGSPLLRGAISGATQGGLETEGQGNGLRDVAHGAIMGGAFNKLGDALNLAGGTTKKLKEFISPKFEGPDSPVLKETPEKPSFKEPPTFELPEQDISTLHPGMFQSVLNDTGLPLESSKSLQNKMNAYMSLNPLSGDAKIELGKNVKRELMDAKKSIQSTKTSNYNDVNNTAERKGIMVNPKETIDSVQNYMNEVDTSTMGATVKNELEKLVQNMGNNGITPKDSRLARSNISQMASNMAKNYESNDAQFNAKHLSNISNSLKNDFDNSISHDPEVVEKSRSADQYYQDAYAPFRTKTYNDIVSKKTPENLVPDKLTNSNDEKTKQYLIGFLSGDNIKGTIYNHFLNSKGQVLPESLLDHYSSDLPKDLADMVDKQRLAIGAENHYALNGIDLNKFNIDKQKIYNDLVKSKKIQFNADLAKTEAQNKIIQRDYQNQSKDVNDYNRQKQAQYDDAMNLAKIGHRTDLEAAKQEFGRNPYENQMVNSINKIPVVGKGINALIGLTGQGLGQGIQKGLRPYMASPTPTQEEIDAQIQPYNENP